MAQTGFPSDRHAKRPLTHLRRALLAAGLFLLAAAGAAAAPTCGGSDLVRGLKEQEPQAYARLLKAAGEIANGEGLLWRIEKPGTAPSHLFGTIHITDERVTTLPAPVLRALKASKAVAVESVEAMDRKRMADSAKTYQALMNFQDGRTLAQHLSERDRVALKQALGGLGIELKKLGAAKPWVILIAISIPVCEIARQGELATVDKVIADTAQKAGISLFSLETVEEQLRAFDGIPLDLQVEYLISGARLYLRLEDMFETMTELYLQRRTGQLQALWKVMGDKTELSQEGFDAINDHLVVRRNKVMVARATPLIEKGAAFIAVGALHLPGDSGLIARLRGRGYKVTRVY